MREYYYMYVVTSGYALEASSGNLNVSYFGSSLFDIYQCFIQVSMIPIYVALKSLCVKHKFDFFVISLGRVVVPFPKIVINLPRTNEKLPC